MLQRARGKVDSKKMALWRGIAAILVIACCATGSVVWILRHRIAEPASARNGVAQSGVPRANVNPPGVARVQQQDTGSSAKLSGSTSAESAASPNRPDLSEEEIALVDKYSHEGLSRALLEAQNAYVTAKPEESAEADRRYLLILNLIAKLDPPPAPQPPALEKRRAEYLEALPVEEARVAALPPAERAAELEQFKETFFKDFDEVIPQPTPGAHK